MSVSFETFGCTFRSVLPTVTRVDYGEFGLAREGFAREWFTNQPERFIIQGSASSVNNRLQGEIMTAETRGNSDNDQPPTYSEVGLPPKYNESMTPELV